MNLDANRRELHRIQTLRQRLVDNQLEAFLTMHVQNIRYLCGFTGTAAVLTVGHDAARLYVDGRYTEQAQKQTVGVEVVDSPRPVLAYVLSQLQNSVSVVGFERNRVMLGEFQQMQAALPSAHLVGFNNLIEELRAVKDGEELSRMLEAIQIADDVYDSFCGWVRPGMVEDHVAARLEYEQRVRGGERNGSGMTVVSSGARTSLPHGIASKKVIDNNQPLMIDIGTVVGGYCSDLTRTVHLGAASPEFRQLYEVVFEAQQCALDGIRPGMTGIEADALARRVIEAAGHGDRFNHSLGHAIGLDVHELPLLNPRDGTVLKENMVFTIEPGVYIPGWAGVRIEDIALVTANGCQLLSKCKRELLEL